MAIQTVALQIYLRMAEWLEERREGQGLAEYALILALVAVLCMAALSALQGGITNTLTSVANAL